MGGYQRESSRWTDDRHEQARQSARERMRAAVDAMDPTQTGDFITEDATIDNAFLLVAGDHALATVNRAGTHIKGLPGARIVTACTFAADTGRVEGVTFAAPDTAAAMVTLTAVARVAFIGCTFRRGGRSTGAYVSVTAGGRATFNGCVFDGTATAGSLVNNLLGLAAAVNVIGSRNATGLVHVNVTAVGNI